MATDQRVFEVQEEERVFEVQEELRVFVVEGDGDMEDAAPVVTRLQFGFLFLFPYEE